VKPNHNLCMTIFFPFGFLEAIEQSCVGNTSACTIVDARMTLYITSSTRRLSSASFEADLVNKTIDAIRTSMSSNSSVLYDIQGVDQLLIRSDESSALNKEINSIETRNKDSKNMFSTYGWLVLWFPALVLGIALLKRYQSAPQKPALSKAVHSPVSTSHDQHIGFKERDIIDDDGSSSILVVDDDESEGSSFSTNCSSNLEINQKGEMLISDPLVVDSTSPSIRFESRSHSFAHTSDESSSIIVVDNSWDDDACAHDQCDGGTDVAFSRELGVSESISLMKRENESTDYDGTNRIILPKAEGYDSDANYIGTVQNVTWA